MESLLNKLKALSDETRLGIVNLIMERELCICQIQAVLNMSQPRISRHMRILRESGLIESRKEAQRTYYSIIKSGNEQLYKALNSELNKERNMMKMRSIAHNAPLCAGSVK